MVRPVFFFHMAASLPIHPRWGYVALGSNVGDRCECPKIGSTPGGFDRFDLHIGILTIDLNIKHGKITISIGVLFDVERFLREYLLYTWYSSYGSMIVPPQPSGWYPPRSFFEHIWGGSSGVSPPLASWPLSSIKQIKQHGEAPDSQTSHVFLGWNALNPSRSTKSSRFFMIFLFVASKSHRLRHLSRSIKSLVHLEGVELLRTSGPQWDPRSSSRSVAKKRLNFMVYGGCN